MFNFSKFVLIATLFSLTFTSCGSDDDDSGSNTTSSFFQCKIDGETYKVTGDNNAFAQKISNDLFGIYGNEDPTKPNPKRVYISLIKAPSVGSFEIKDNETGNASILLGSTLYNSAFPGGTGSIKIDELTNTRIKGSFSFVGVTPASESKKVTEGSFDVAIK